MRAAMLLILPALAGCQRHDRASADPASMNEAKINVNAGHGNRAVAITADGASGRVAVDIPGFNGNFAVPKAMFDHGNVDIDGVGLYPGATVKTVDVTADKDAGAGGTGRVRVGFVAADAPAKVADWFAARFRDKGVVATRTGNGFAGTTRDGSAFTVALDPASGGGTNALLVVLANH